MTNPEGYVLVPREPTILQVLREVSELPDRTSPDDQPDMMLVTYSELESILREALSSTPVAVSDKPCPVCDGDGYSISDLVGRCPRGCRPGKPASAVVDKPEGEALDDNKRLTRETPFERRRYLKHVPPVEGDGATRRHWIIVQEPGCIPEKKGHFLRGQLEPFLRELLACRPAGTHYTFVTLTWDFDIWVESGREFLTTCDVYSEIASVPTDKRGGEE